MVLILSEVFGDGFGSDFERQSKVWGTELSGKTKWQTDTEWISTLCWATYVSWKLSGRLVGSDGEWKGLWATCITCFPPFSVFVSLPLTYTLCLLIIKISSQRSDIYYLLTTASSPLWLLEVLQLCVQVWSVTKGEGWILLCSSRGEWREVCVPGTPFLQHAVTSLQLFPSLMLPDRWGCV